MPPLTTMTIIKDASYCFEAPCRANLIFGTEDNTIDILVYYLPAGIRVKMQGLLDSPNILPAQQWTTPKSFSDSALQ